MTRLRMHIQAAWLRTWFGLTQFATGIRRGDPVQPASSIAEILIRLAYGQRYRYDRRAGAMRHPRYVQALINRNSMQIGDCEDHAGYWAAVLHKSGIAANLRIGVIWYRTKGVEEGHTVCLFEKDHSWFWVDYGTPRYLAKINDWTADVVSIYGDTFESAILYTATLSAHDKVRLSDPKVYTAS